MDIVVIDGQGGGIGKSIIENVKKEIENVNIIGVGTNALATAALLKAGADVGATGENAVCYNCGNADVIMGPIGIMLANSMYGEISAKMANAVTQSKAIKLLIPISKCNVKIMGIEEKNMAQYIAQSVLELKEIIG